MFYQCPKNIFFSDKKIGFDSLSRAAKLHPVNGNLSFQGKGRGNSDIIQQTAVAFDFIQKLYFEVSYMIKEIEGILGEEEEKFVTGKPSGYGISVRSSTGLESNNVLFWMYKKFAVFFVPEDKTRLEKSQTVTDLVDDLKVLYLRIVLNDKSIAEPTVYFGVLYDIRKKTEAKWFNKFEYFMGHIQYNDNKIFKNPENITYEDATVSFKGKLIKNNLYDINDSKTIYDKLVKPSLLLYRGIEESPNA